MGKTSVKKIIETIEHVQVKAYACLMSWPEPDLKFSNLYENFRLLKNVPNPGDLNRSVLYRDETYIDLHAFTRRRVGQYRLKEKSCM